MIKGLSHVTVRVFDQDVAKTFYVDKLGFEVREDQMMGDNMRWLTVRPKQQPDMEIALLARRRGR